MTYTAKIYKITCSCCGKIYVGSTKQSRLCKRLWGHMSDSKKECRNSKLYTHMSEQGFEKFTILLLETIEVNDLDEQRKLENDKIEELDTINDGFNERRAYRSVEVRKQSNKISNAKYTKNNREKINIMVKNYRDNLPKSYVCECCNYSTSRKDTYDRHLKGGRHKRKEHN
jgi:group I intron endonuclease